MINHLYDIFRKWSYTDGRNKNSIWVFSDPHFGDAESMGFRGEGFPVNDEMVKRINSKVGRKDTIIFLGDIGDVEYVKKVRGYKVLIMGNHDKGASNYKREIKSVEKLYAMPMRIELPYTFDQYDESEAIRLKVKGDFPKCEYVQSKFVEVDNHLFDEVYEGPLMVSERLILSHEPIEGMPFLFNIHGHIHSKDYKGNETHMNVCAEAIDCTPVNLISFMANGGLGNIKGIHRITVDDATKRKSKRKPKRKGDGV